MLIDQVRFEQIDSRSILCIVPGEGWIRDGLEMDNKTKESLQSFLQDWIEISFRSHLQMGLS